MVHNFRQVVVFSNSSSSKALFEIGLKSSTWALVSVIAQNNVKL